MTRENNSPPPANIECLAIIPARGGSKGIPRKNLQILNGIPLIGRTIMAARKSVHVQKVYVSTEDSEIAAKATDFQAEVLWRPSVLASDAASSESALLDGLAQLKEQGISPDLLVFLQCTSPFTNSMAIDKVIAELEASQCSMAFSAVEDHGFLWGIDENTGTGYGINHDHRAMRKRRQETPKQLRETGAIYVMRTSDFEKQGTRFCGTVKPVEIDLPHLEIDTPQDMEAAAAMLRICGPA